MDNKEIVKRLLEINGKSNVRMQSMIDKLVQAIEPNNFFTEGQLCEFSRNDDFEFISTNIYLEYRQGFHVCNSGEYWQFCRPVDVLNIDMIRTNGLCPELDELQKVIVIYDSGEISAGKKDLFDWKCIHSYKKINILE